MPPLAFRPDFHLPRSDLYIGVTTLNQKLVTKKNRKVRLLRERHPEILVRLLYRSDYLELLVKYGLESPDQLADVPGAVAEPAGEGLGLLGTLPRPATDEGSRRQSPAA